MIFIEMLVLTVWAAAAQKPVQAQQVERAREV